jgi:hypothetical protein
VRLDAPGAVVGQVDLALVDEDEVGGTGFINEIDARRHRWI